MIDIESDVTLAKYLQELDIKIRPAVIPTLLQTTIYKDGIGHEEYIVQEEHQKLFYQLLGEYIKEQIIEQITNNNDQDIPMLVEDIVKTMRVTIRQQQRIWSGIFGDKRSKWINTCLDYVNIVHRRHLTHEQRLPIEMIVRFLFNVKPYYGQLRERKTRLDKEDFFLIKN